MVLTIIFSVFSFLWANVAPYLRVVYSFVSEESIPIGISDFRN